MNEIWKDVPDYEGYYQVSNLGKVRSVDRVITHSYSGTAKLKGKLLRLTLHKSGYFFCSLSKGCHRKTGFVHQLVMSAFVGKQLDGMDVAHNDGNSTNNHLSNLRYATRKENQADRITHGTHNRGERQGASKLTESDVKDIRWLSQFHTYSSIATFFRLSRRHITDVVNGKCWAHI